MNWSMPLSESFKPGQLGWDALSEASRDEILQLFPELRSSGMDSYGALVRPALKAHEVQLLLS